LRYLFDYAMQDILDSRPWIAAAIAVKWFLNIHETDEAVLI
jgi:hypothetical protein